MRIGRLFCKLLWSNDPGAAVGGSHTSYLSVKKLRRPGKDVSFLIFAIYLAFALYPRKQQP